MRLRPSSLGFLLAFGATLCGPAQAGSAPDWMRSLVDVPLPAHDEKTDAIELYSETAITVAADGKITRLERKVFKILRPDGARRGTVDVYFRPQTHIEDLRAWCIPSSGKDYEVKERDAVDMSLDIANGELVGDLRVKRLQIPAAIPGSVVGYELREEQRTYVLEDEWRFQDTIPVREAHYRLQLPRGWTYKATWLHHDNDSPIVSASGQLQWNVSNVDAIKIERHMPPWQGIAGGLVVAFLPPGGKDAGFQTWAEFGSWYLSLVAGRRDPSSPIKQKVLELTASLPTLNDKIKALATFVQNDIRYVAIELGIGGYQPHPAAEIFLQGYGDCKDKATLLSAMLKEIGVDSYYVIIYSERGAVDPLTPPNLGFNHVILAIALPAGTEWPNYPARVPHPDLGNILFFDPTDPLTPFGRIRGPLQANYGVLLAPKGGELTALPQLPPASSSLNRWAEMSLEENGTVRGEVHEEWTGDRAGSQRYALRSAKLDTDQIKPVESNVGASFTNFRVLKATVGNLRAVELPFHWNYSLEAQDYAKTGGDLVLVRPRLMGIKASPLLETTEKRRAAIEFDETFRDTDIFEITVPPDYKVDELPPPVHTEAAFGRYDSKTEMNGRVLRYTRTFEIDQPSLPASQSEELKEFYRAVARDERAVAVFKKDPRQTQ